MQIHESHALGVAAYSSLTSACMLRDYAPICMQKCTLSGAETGLNQCENTSGNRNTCFTRENWENGLFGPLGQPSIGQQ